MSASAHERGSAKHLCVCGRRATFCPRGAHGRQGRRRARADHPLCGRCWRALVDRHRPAPFATRWLPDELLSRLLACAAVPEGPVCAELAASQT